MPPIARFRKFGSPIVLFCVVLRAATLCSNVAGSEKTFSELTLEELTRVKITTISRIDESIDDAPGSVYTFSRELIRNRGYQSLGELLQVVPGFTVFHKDLQFVTGVRGLNANDNEKVTLLINGQELNQIGEPDFLNGPINLDTIKKVEVVVGPSSFFQQANTLAATINIITMDLDGMEVIASSGNSLPYSGTLIYGKRWNPDRSLTFSFTSEKKKGFDAWDPDFRPNLAGRRVTGRLDWPNYFSVLKGQIAEWSGQLVAYRTTFPELLISNGDPANDGQLVDQFYTLNLKNEHPWSTELKSFAKMSATLKEQTRLNSGGTPTNALQVSNKQWAYTAEAGLHYTGFEKHHIQTGAQGSFDHNFDSWFTFNQTAPPIVYPRTTLVDQDTYALGFYLDDTFKATDVLKLIAGVRTDKNTRLQGDRWFLGGRAALILEASPSWRSKLIFNRAVRMPAPWASHLNRSWGIDKPNTPPFAAFSANANRPEILSTFEFQNIFYFESIRFGTSLYHQDLKDFISWLEPHSNVGNFRGNGVEINIQAPLHSHLTLWGNATFNDSTLDAKVAPTSSPIEAHHVEVNFDGRIIGSPKFTANIGSDLKIINDLNFSPTIRYFTSQAAYDFSTQSFISITHRYYLDAALTLKNWKPAVDTEIDVRLSGLNLLNNRDSIAGQWLRDTYKPRGISVVLSADIRL